MNSVRRRSAHPAHPVNAFAILLLLLLLVAPSRASAQGQSAKDWLLTDPPGNSAAAQAAARNDAAVVKQKPMVLNHGYLQSAIAKGNGQVSLTLLDGTPVDVVLERVEYRAPGNFTWYGKVVGDDKSSVILTAVKGYVSGTITFGVSPTVYQIKPGTSGAHWLQKLDQRAFPPDHPNGNVPRAPKTASEGDGTGMTTAGVTAQGTASVTIDVMIVWSNQAAAAVGAGMDSESQHAVDIANTVYANSGINAALRLVYAGAVNYSDSGDFPTDLNRLTTPKDGYLDEVQGLRDQYGADLVSLFVENMQYCGYGWIGPGVNYAFTVVNRSCASGNYSFPHETGHNMGALHDPYADPSTSPYAYGHGYANVSQGWRTVMAYNSVCSAAGVNCTRVPYLSNPLATYPGTGAPLGTPSSGSSPTSDNARVHAQNLATVAGFRGAATAGGCTYSLAPAGTSVGPGAGSGSFGVTSGSGCAWNATSASSWLGISSSSGTSGTGTLYFTVAANGGPARSATIAVGNQAFTVSQASGCTYSVTPGSASYGAGGGTGSVTVTTGAGCTWTASSGASWVNKLSATSGSGSATITYSVDPNTGSARTGNLNVGTATATITEAAATIVNGTPAASLSPSSLGFGSVNTGKKSAVQTATFTNSGTGTLTISGVTDGGDTAQFVRGGTCAAGFALAPGASCTVTYQFAPKVSGSFTATTAVTSNAATAPAVTATGTGKFRGK